MSVSNDCTGSPGIRGAVCVSKLTGKLTIRLKPFKSPVPRRFNCSVDWTHSFSPSSVPPNSLQSISGTNEQMLPGVPGCRQMNSL